MKIANIVCTYPPYKGGIGTAADNFRRLISARGHEVRTFVPDYGNQVSGPEDKADNILRLKPFLQLGNGAFLPQLFFHLKRFDVLFLHYPFFGGAEVVWLFKLFYPKQRLIIQYHMDVEKLSGWRGILSIPSRIIGKSLFKKADKIVTGSVDYIEHGVMAETYQRYKNKFIEMPYGVDTDKFSPKEKDYDVFKILFVGGLDQAHYFKGLNILLEALALFDQQTKQKWELNIVGSGDLEQTYQTQARELNIAFKVNFLGNVSAQALPEIYATSSVTVLPSINKSEAFGIVLIESMACGTAVIASDLAGVRKVFANSQEGLLVKPGSIDDLLEKIKYLANNAGQVKQMSHLARAKALTKYSSLKVGDKLAEALGL